MEHTHNYPDGSQQMPFAIPDLDDVLRRRSDPSMSETVDTARAKLVEQLAELKKSNAQQYTAMLQMGMQPSPTAILMARLEQLLDMLLDPDARLGFDLGFEARMAKILSDGLTEARQGQLLPHRGPSGPIGNVGHPGLILPN